VDSEFVFWLLGSALATAGGWALWGYGGALLAAGTCLLVLSLPIWRE
jgi:hypothetical protein